MQSASIVLALCLLAKASADSSYGSSSGDDDMSEACQAAKAAFETANGDIVYTCLDSNGVELDGTCDISTFSFPDETASLQATGKCMAMNLDLAAMISEGDDYEPEVTAGSDQCGTACTTAISTMETSGCVSAGDAAEAELVKINAACDSATMAGAALALIAVALF